VKVSVMYRKNMLLNELISLINLQKGGGVFYH